MLDTSDYDDFDSRFAMQAAERIIDQFSESVIYTDRTGTRHTLSAIIGDERTEERETSIGIQKVIVREITLEKNGVTEQLNGTVQAAGFEYAIESLEEGPGVVTARLVRFDAAELSRDGYRYLA